MLVRHLMRGVHKMGTVKATGIAEAAFGKPMGKTRNRKAPERGKGSSTKTTNRQMLPHGSMNKICHDLLEQRVVRGSEGGAVATLSPKLFSRERAWQQPGVRTTCPRS